MKYLKYFESQSEPNLKEKIDSIVSMYQYLWDLGIGDSLGNFTGECSIIFTGFIDHNSGWRKGGKLLIHSKLMSLSMRLITIRYMGWIGKW